MTTDTILVQTDAPSTADAVLVADPVAVATTPLVDPSDDGAESVDSADVTAAAAAAAQSATIDFVVRAQALLQLAEALVSLQSEDLFKSLSKKTRNELLEALLEKSREIEEASRATHRALKHVKRERLPEDLADDLILYAVLNKNDIGND